MECTHRWRCCLRASSSTRAPKRLAERCEKLRMTISHRLSGDSSLMGGLLEGSPCRGDPKRGRREVADGISLPDSEGTVFEAACACSKNTVAEQYCGFSSCCTALITQFRLLARGMDGKESRSSCLGTIGCVCVRRPSSRQRANGLGLFGQLCARRWYMCSVGHLATTCVACPS